ncbi:MAG: radical SAM protein [Candidatus Omnitrophota bacterium]
MSISIGHSNIGIFLSPSPRGPGMIKSPPLDIANLVAILRNNESFDVKLIDSRAHVLNEDSFWERKGINLSIFNDFKRCFDHLLVKQDPLISYTSIKILSEVKPEHMEFMIFSVAVLEQFSLQYLISSLCIARQMKEKYPGIKIVFFGNCPKKHARKIMGNFSFLDAFLEDGNEYSALQYIKNYKRCSPIDGITYREKNRLIYSRKGRKLDLDKYPVPEFALFDLKKYKCNGKLVLPYEISRGCINDCFFCYYIHKGKMAYKNIDKVTDELKYLSRKYDTQYFHFMDAEINFDDDYLGKLCGVFNKRLPHIRWSALAIPNINNELLVKMRKAGCVQLRWGVEYASERMLKIIGKKTSVKEIKEVLKNAHHLGIYNYITLLTGLGVERKKDIEDTKGFIKGMSPYIDSIKECVWGELGHFSILRLDNLLNNKQGKEITQRQKYGPTLRGCDITSEDIIDVITRFGS